MKDALKTVMSCSGGVLPYMAYTGMCPLGVLPHKSDGGSRRKILRTPLKRYQKLALWACPKFISTPKRHQFNNEKLCN